MFSLPDWAFYPIASLVVGGMIFGALRSGDVSARSPEDILENGILYDGNALSSITLGNGLDATVMVENDHEFARISALRGPLDGPQSAGAFFTLAPNELEILQSHVIQLTYSVRASAESGASSTNLSFFVPGIGQDSWQNFAVTEDYADFTLTIIPPSCQWESGYIGIWPDWTTHANSVDVQSVKIEALEAIDCQ